jgi:hypothetical protein
VHLASDLHPPYNLPENERDSPVVICSELPNKVGSSITCSSHQIAAEVIRHNDFASPPVWIEHYPKESTGEGAEEQADDAAGLRRLFLEKRSDGRRAALQGDAVFLREGVHLLALDVDGAHDLPACSIRDRDDDL